MSKRAISFLHPQAQRKKADILPFLCRGLQKFMILLSLQIVLYACVPLTLTAKDRAAINAGNKALVLVRISCTVDGRPFEPCIYRRNDPVLSDRLFVGFAMGSFDTFGEPALAKFQTLSNESFDAGWTFILVPPGIYYLYIRGPDSSESSHTSATDYYRRYYRDGPRWRIDVPEGAKLIYAGTLTLAGKQTGTLLFGDPIIVPEANQQVRLNDESETADSLLAAHFQGIDIHNLLMRPWMPGEPFIFRSPLLIK